MTPPISINGTDITGATIDGQDVNEITADGQIVFSAEPPLPASTVTRIDGTSINTSTTPNRVNDVVGANDFDIIDASVGNFGGRSNVLTFDASSNTAYELPPNRASPDINLKGQDFTVMAVFRLDGAIGQLAPDGTVNVGYVNFLSVEGNNTGLWAQGNTTGDPVPVLWYQNGNNTENATGVQPDVWHLATCTFDSSQDEFTVCRDDPLGSGTSGVFTGADAEPTEDWTIEKITIGSRTDSDYKMNGGIDVVEFHNKEFSLQEISDAYSRLV